MCLVVSRAIEKIVVSKDHPSFSGDESPLAFCSGKSYIEAGNSWSLVLVCKKAVEMIKSPPLDQTANQDIIMEVGILIYIAANCNSN